MTTAPNPTPRRTHSSVHRKLIHDNRTHSSYATQTAVYRVWVYSVYPFWFVFNQELLILFLLYALTTPPILLYRCICLVTLFLLYTLTIPPILLYMCICLVILFLLYTLTTPPVLLYMCVCLVIQLLQSCHRCPWTLRSRPCWPSC